MSTVISLVLLSLFIIFILYVQALIELKRDGISNKPEKLKDLFPEIQQDPQLLKKVNNLSVEFSLIKDRIRESAKNNSQIEESQRDLQAKLASLDDMVISLGDEVFSLQAVNRSILETKKVIKKPKVKSKKRR